MTIASAPAWLACLAAATALAACAGAPTRDAASHAAAANLDAEAPTLEGSVIKLASAGAPVPLAALVPGERSPRTLYYVDDLDGRTDERGRLGAHDRAVLEKLAARLRRERLRFSVEVQGRPTTSGDAAGNLYRALQRAQAVGSFLQRAAGLPDGQLSVVSLAAPPAEANAHPVVVLILA